MCMGRFVTEATIGATQKDIRMTNAIKNIDNNVPKLVVALYSNDINLLRFLLEKLQGITRVEYNALYCMAINLNDYDAASVLGTYTNEHITTEINSHIADLAHNNDMENFMKYLNSWGQGNTLVKARDIWECLDDTKNRDIYLPLFEKHIGTR